MKLFLFILSLIITSLNGLGQVGDLVWEDNFDGNILDSNKWNYETGTGVNGDFGTGQIDRATDRKKNVSFQNNVPGAENGCLVITTDKEYFIDRNYTSGRINTKGKASWGPGHRIIARVFPRDVKQKGQGFAFWMMPDEIPIGWEYIMWPQGGELDIMEYVGSIPYHNLGSVHYAWFWQNNQWVDWNHGHSGAYYSYKRQEVPIPSEPGYGNYPPTVGDSNAGSAGFHNYGIDWYKDRIEFFVDENVYHIHYLNDGDAFYKDGQDGFAISKIDGKRTGVSEYSNHFTEWYPFEHKMFAILSAGVGGADHTYGGAIVPEAQFPCSVFVDWVRVFKLDNQVGIDQQKTNSNIHIYPNPVSAVLNIKSENSEDFEVIIVDTSGRVVVVQYEFNSSLEIDVSNFKKGIYTVFVKSKIQSVSKKIIVQ